MSGIESAQLQFSSDQLYLVNAAIGCVLFGVALDLRPREFLRVLQVPKAPLIGLMTQFFLLPAMTYVLVRTLDVSAGLQLGLIVVAACPGGNMSNIITHLAGGNTALSVSMSAISSMLSVVATPFNIAFWGGMLANADPRLAAIQMDGTQMFVSILLILGLPLAAGMTVAQLFPKFAAKCVAPMKKFALLFFMILVGGAFAGNWSNFVTYIGEIAVIVAIHNALALGLGWWMGGLAKLTGPDRKAVCIEVGVQNAGLGLAIIFNFFGGAGGAAIIAAWWGIWHIIAGTILAISWSRHSRKEILV